MFSYSSQLKFWTFSGTTEIQHLRTEANQKFIAEHGAEYEGDFKTTFFLNQAEEHTLCRHYEYHIKQFCLQFQPPMPRYVLGTSIAYFKRFYLHNSVMDYHPQDIIYTCVYLACKVEEFNVSIGQFIANMVGDQEHAMDLILSQELLVMHELHYHLTVHNPFRPLEGFLIDIKTRYPEAGDVEKLRRGAEEFIDRSLHTDTVLIFSPSQIALAAILSSAGKIGVSLDSYVSNTLLGSGTKEDIIKAVEHIKRIRYMVKHQEPLAREEVRSLELKISECRNQENNPESDEYRQKQEDSWDMEEDRRAKKRVKQAAADREADQALLGI